MLLIKNIYVHVPLCINHCNFCNFYKEDYNTYKYLSENGRYADLLTKELEMYREVLDKELESIYIGGGSPLLLDSGIYNTFFDYLAKNHSLENTEITMESNPVFTENSRLLESGWIKRLSIGIQSFAPATLKLLGRTKQVDPAFLDYARKHIRNISIDMIFDIPGQTVDDLKADLEKALAYEPQHMSWYSLENKKDSSKEGKLFAEEFPLIRNRLKENGYELYEISNYARPGFKCRHNMAYWHYKSFLGLGPGASGLIDLDPDREPGLRYCNQRSIPDHISLIEAGKKPHGFTEKIDDRIRRNEFILSILRTPGGIDPGLFQDRFNCDFRNRCRSALSKNSSYMVDSGNSIYLSEKGLLYYNKIASDFMEI